MAQTNRILPRDGCRDDPGERGHVALFESSDSREGCAQPETVSEVVRQFPVVDMNSDSVESIEVRISGVLIRSHDPDVVRRRPICIASVAPRKYRDTSIMQVIFKRQRSA